MYRTIFVIAFLEFLITNCANSLDISVSSEQPILSEEIGRFLGDYTKNSSLGTPQFSQWEGTTHRTTEGNVNEYEDFWYNDYNSYNYLFGNSYMYDKRLTFEEIDSYLNTISTKTFLSKFVNDVHRETVKQQLRYCPFIDLCTFSLNLTHYLDANKSCCSPCACDYPKCLTYQTCCPDLLPPSMFYANESMFTSSDEDIIDDNILTCTLLHAKMIHGKPQKSAYTYAKCPRGTDEQMVHLCTRTYTADVSDVEDMLPATTKTDRITYRNKYCAFCNGISEDQMEIWSVQLSCDKNIHSTVTESEKSLLDLLFYRDTCDLAFRGHWFDETRRCKTSISTCNETGLWNTLDNNLVLRCLLYISDIVAYSKSYRNVFCLQCNGYEPKLPSKYCEEANPGSHTWGSGFAFSGLIKLKSLRGKAVTGEKYASSECTLSQIYDKTTDECRTLLCSELYRLQDQLCVKMFESIGPMIYMLYIRIFPVDKTTIYDVHLLMDDVLKYLQTYILKNPLYFSNISMHIHPAQMIYTANVTYFANNSIDIIGGSNLLNIDARFELRVDGDHDPYKLTDTLNKLYNIPILLNAELEQKESQFNFTVIDDSTNPLYDIVKIISEDDIFNNYSYSTGYPAPLSELIRYSASDENKNTIIPYFHMNSKYLSWGDILDSLKVVAIRDCPAVKISITDFTLTDTDTDRVLRYKGFSFKSSQFGFENNQTIIICVEELERYLNQASAKVPGSVEIDNIEMIISIIGVSISICCLALTLVTFSLFSSLRTFPGLNTMSLCFFLSVANSLYLIGSFGGINHPVVCKVVGITLHFSLLSALLWMNICTFHMFRVLTHTRPRTAIKWSTFVLYHSYAILCSCVCISANIGVSLFRSGNTDIGYGEGVCYISSESMKTFTFGLPVLLIVLSNIVMFSVVVIAVKRKSSIHRSSSNERNDLLIFTKLSTLTGSTWLFGFIYFWTDLYVFSYIFTVLNSFQGIFVMLSFVVNQRIFNLYKTSFQGWTKTSWSGSGTRIYNVTTTKKNQNTTTEKRKSRKWKLLRAGNGFKRDTPI